MAKKEGNGVEAQMVKVSKEDPTLGSKQVTGPMNQMGYDVNKKLAPRVSREAEG